MDETIVQLAGGTVAVTTIGFAAAVLLTLASRRYAAGGETVVDRINRELPQTQCAQCGYPGCRPYAEAIVEGEAINKCPPGGEATVVRLADLLGRPAEPLDTTGGTLDDNRVAVIVEEECIGCGLCIKACPVDAIVGAPQLMHTVIESECTGCDLCIDPCPVDCIKMVERPVQQTESPLPVSPADEMPCIHCDRCETACPRDLQPQHLLWYLDTPEQLEALDLASCIECGLCDDVCPSNIALAPRFHNARLALHERQEQTRRTNHHEARYLRKRAREQKEAERIKQRPDKQDRAVLIGAIKRKVAS